MFAGGDSVKRPGVESWLEGHRHHLWDPSYDEIISLGPKTTSPLPEIDPHHKMIPPDIFPGQ
eukprot:6203465-Pyramimonas_sp.AAC.1